MNTINISNIRVKQLEYVMINHCHLYDKRYKKSTEKRYERSMFHKALLLVSIHIQRWMKRHYT